MAKASPIVLLIGGGSSIPYLLNFSSPSVTEASSLIKSTQDNSINSHKASGLPNPNQENAHSMLQTEKPKNCEVREESEVSKLLPTS